MSCSMQSTLANLSLNVPQLLAQPPVQYDQKLLAPGLTAVPCYRKMCQALPPHPSHGLTSSKRKLTSTSELKKKYAPGRRTTRRRARYPHRISRLSAPRIRLVSSRKLTERERRYGDQLDHKDHKSSHMHDGVLAVSTRTNRLPTRTNARSYSSYSRVARYPRTVRSSRTASSAISPTVPSSQQQANLPGDQIMLSLLQPEPIPVT